MAGASRVGRCAARFDPNLNLSFSQARILSPSEALESALKSESRPNKAPVAFFGDSAVAWVPEDRIMAWPAGLSLQTTRRKYALLWKAILEVRAWRGAGIRHAGARPGGGSTSAGRPLFAS